MERWARVDKVAIVMIVGFAALVMSCGFALGVVSARNAVFPDVESDVPYLEAFGGAYDRRYPGDVLPEAYSPVVAYRYGSCGYEYVNDSGEWFVFGSVEFVSNALPPPHCWWKDPTRAGQVPGARE